MKLKDIEVEFSFTDADCIERLEKASKRVKEETEKYKKQEMDLSKAIRKECEIINNDNCYKTKDKQLR